MPETRTKRIAFSIAVLLVFGCDKKQTETDQASPTATKNAPIQAQTVEKKSEQPKAVMPELLAPTDPDEACGQVIVVAWKGAAHASAEITRDKAQAQAKAQELLQRVKQNPDFASLAKQNSDAKSSGPRGGIMGTYRKAKWPKIHQPIRDIIFSLKVNQIADELVEAPYGYVIAKRCLVEKIPTRHILVRYQGAKNAPNQIKRSREQAKMLANEILAELLTSGADFAEVARKKSEDASAKRGGDIGTPARGQLALPFEEALFSMSPGEIRGPVETEFGFHIIQRKKDE